MQYRKQGNKMPTKKTRIDDITKICLSRMVYWFKILDAKRNQSATKTELRIRWVLILLRIRDKTTKKQSLRKFQKKTIMSEEKIMSK